MQEKAGVEEPEIDEEAEEENLKPSSLAFPQLDLSTATTSTHTVSRVSGKVCTHLVLTSRLETPFSKEGLTDPYEMRPSIV